MVGGWPRQRLVLAILAMDVGRVVPTELLLDRIWEDRPPDKARRTIHSYVSRIRRSVEEIGGTLVHRNGGYELRIHPEKVDVHHFRRLVADAGSPAADRLTTLRTAVDLRAGQPLAGLGGSWAELTRQALEQEYASAVVAWADAELLSGDPQRAIGPVTGLAAEQPLLEPLAAVLVRLLAAVGQVGEALEHYTVTRQRLVEELGAEPGALLRAAHQEVLHGRPAPNQLPAAPGHFVGRDAELARLLRPAPEGGTVAVAALQGMAGVGKTALAVFAAHRLVASGHCPDGVLYVDLHGYADRQPLHPAEALDTLLQGLGVPGDQVPREVDGRTGLYRSLTARRRVLVVLDNARDEAQVRPLLPGAATCRVLITSRRRLAGLDDADHLMLGTLPAADAVRLFRAVAARDCDEGTAAEIARLCGWLPLAIRIAAARLRSSTALTPQAMLRLLRGGGDALDDGDRSIAAALDLSYRHLTSGQQQAFALLGQHPGGDLEPGAAGALLDAPPERAGRVLVELERFNLLQEAAAGRYRFHDLVRAYAASKAVAGPAALDRLYEHYARTAAAAVALAYPYHLPARPAVPGLADRAAALAWLRAEQPNLVATARHAAGHGRPDHTLRQAATLHHDLLNRGSFGQARTLHLAALRLAVAGRDRTAELGVLNALGQVHYRLGRYRLAAGYHARALLLARTAGSDSGAILALNGLGWTRYVRGRATGAARCYRRALRLAGSRGDPAAEVEALTGLGNVHFIGGAYGEAAACYTRAARVAVGTADLPGELSARTGVAWTCRALGRYDEAAERYAQVIALARAAGNVTSELNALNGLGNINYVRGRFEHAIPYYRQAADLAEAIGSTNGELGALVGLGHTRNALGDRAAARGHFERALDLARATGELNAEYEAQLGLGRAHHSAGDPTRAAAAHERALALATTLSQPPDQIRALDGLALAHLAMGQPSAARRYWQRALREFAGIDTMAAEDVTAAAIGARLAALTGTG